MKTRQFFKFLLCTILGVVLHTKVHSQDFSAGINIDSPNPNAVLHLVSPNSNQGLLVPTLTTGQRQAMGLSALENGMLIFDSDQGLFYYWLDPNWIPLITSETTQTLELNALDLRITGGNSVDLSTLGFISSESDPSVPDTIKDGIDWSELSGIPADIADGDDSGGASTVNVDGTTVVGDGDLAPLAVNFGTGANQIVQLNGSAQLPAVDGSLLTGIAASAIAANSVLSNNIADGEIVDADVSATAAIAGSKISPDFAAQNITTTGTITGSSFSGDGSALTGVTATIGANSINNSEIADNSVESLNIVDGTVSNVDISDVDWSKLSTVPADLADGDDVDDADADPTNENQTVSAGAGITVNQTGQDFEVVNSLPDQTVVLADGGSGNVTIGGTYPSFTIDVPDNLDNDPANEDQTVSAGTGISVNQNADDFEVTNTAPDQTVALADGGSGNVTIGGTYPSFTIDVPDNLDNDPANEDQTVSAGTGISVNQNADDFEVTNTAPDQTVALADGGSGNVTIGGTYPSFTIDVANVIASAVSFSNAGNVAATDVQAAITELDNEKLALAGGTMSGSLNMGTNSITDVVDPTNAQDVATKNYVDGLGPTFQMGFSQDASTAAFGSSMLVPAPAGKIVQVIDDTGGGGALLAAATFHNDLVNNSPALALLSARGTIAAPTAVQLNNPLGEVLFNGNFGGGITNIENGASILAKASENWASGSTGGELIFRTTPNGTTGGLDQLLIASNGNVKLFGSGALQVHNGTSVQRPGAASPGMIRYNTTDNKFEGYSTLWSPLGGDLTDAYKKGNDITLDGTNDFNVLSNGGTGIFNTKNNGFVGIGTTTNDGFTSVKLKVQNSAGSAEDVELMLRNEEAGQDAVLTLKSFASGEDAAMFLDDSDGRKLKFSTGVVNLQSERNNLVKMTLDQTGKLGIGTTTPATELDVNGDISGSSVNVAANINLTGNLISAPVGPFNIDPIASDTRIVTVDGGPFSEIVSGTLGQEMIIISLAAGVDIIDVDNGGGTGNIQLANNDTNFLMNVNASLHLVYIGTFWVEIGRSAQP